MPQSACYSNFIVQGKVWQYTCA